jgi:protein TonB
VLPTPDRSVRRCGGALAASLLAHGLTLLAIIWLLHRVIALVPPAETTVAIVFAPTEAPVAATAPPAGPSAPAPAEQNAPPQHEEPTPEATAPAVAQPAPTQEEPPPPTEETAPAIAEPAQEQPLVAPPEKPKPAARPTTAEHLPPRRVAVARPPMPSAASPAVGAAPTQGAAPTVSMSPAHPVAGMESDRPPAYPETARRRGEQGRVVLQVNVSAEGLPVTVSVAESSGYPVLDAAAQTAVQRWRFVPATRGGASVPAVAEVPVRFRLTN